MTSDIPQVTSSGRSVLNAWKTFRSHVDFRYLWIIPIASLSFILLSFAPIDPLVQKEYLEMIAIPLAGLTWVACMIHLSYVKTPFFIILSYLTFAFFMREIHFPGAKAFCYVSLVAVFVWAWIWREKIQPELNDRKLMTWLFTAFVTYGWSQFVARKGLAFIPNELFFHEALEEGSENLGHILMLITSLSGTWTPMEGGGDPTDS